MKQKELKKGDEIRYGKLKAVVLFLSLNKVKIKTENNQEIFVSYDKVKI